MAGFTQRIVKSSELTPGMVIVEITELSLDYATLDDARVKFLQSYFAGSDALVTTEKGIKNVPIGELKTLDHLQGIGSIPATLKISTVVPGLAQFMFKHGLLEFKVKVPAEAPAADGAPKRPAAAPESGPMQPGSKEAQTRHTEKVKEVHKFLETVETATANRDKASTIVEEMLEQGRTGKYSSKGVEQAVAEIIEQGSSPAIKAIAGLRGSDQTYAHCTDMSVILQECYTDILTRTGREPTDANRHFILVAGFMHDIGKSEVPKDILESTQRFPPESQEMLMMRNHATYGARILGDMKMHSVVINVAHYHHVKRDTSLFTSYPEVGYEQVLPVTRLASIVDVYQALIGKRRYKRNWVPGKAIEYLRRLRGTEFDEKMLDYFIETMGIYPVGSLVRLSTNELAFVLMIGPAERPDRPMLAVVENAQGELVTHHTLLDLMLEPDIKVEEVVDHYQHYNKTEDQAYQIFSSIRVDR